MFRRCMAPSDTVLNEQQQQRLENILGWVRTAKETLPAIDDRRVGADRVAQMSALLDRLHAAAQLLGAGRSEPAARDDRAA